MSITKVQTAFDRQLTAEEMQQFEVLNSNVHGQLYNFIIRGRQNEILEKFQSLNPLFVEALPLTLEEVFIYEMEVAGYDVSNIIG